MNERIRELARQVDACYIPRYDMWQMDTESLKKFAELIVRECIQVVDDTMTENQEMNIGLVMASAKIVAHFGVEE